ncbi:hypothetical protein SUGI_1089960 [Cryptomeria japonica]|nr:hypothetical protein SUGI_1089960 [Cryptomeria japonica]
MSIRKEKSPLAGSEELFQEVSFMPFHIFMPGNRISIGCAKLSQAISDLWWPSPSIMKLPESLITARDPFRPISVDQTDRPFLSSNLRWPSLENSD